MFDIKTIQYFIEKILFPGMFFWTAGKIAFSVVKLKGSLENTLLISVQAFLIIQFSLYCYLAFFLLRNQLSSQYRININMFLILIFLIGLLLTPSDIQEPSGLFLISIGFYYCVMLCSYYFLGERLSILPSFKDVIMKGMYKLVRHPIYSCSISIFALIFCFNPNGSNFILFLLVSIISYVRAIEEEKLLMESSLVYEDYKKATPFLFFHPLFLIPFCFVWIFSFFL